jgi:hypothetical protein
MVWDGDDCTAVKLAPQNGQKAASAGVSLLHFEQYDMASIFFFTYINSFCY